MLRVVAPYADSDSVGSAWGAARDWESVEGCFGRAEYVDAIERCFVAENICSILQNEIRGALALAEPADMGSVFYRAKDLIGPIWSSTFSTIGTWLAWSATEDDASNRLQRRRRRCSNFICHASVS